MRLRRGRRATCAAAVWGTPPKGGDNVLNKMTELLRVLAELARALAELIRTIIEYINLH
jgi:hypothetical protein